MANTKAYVGDIGTVILLDCGVNVSSATVQKILVRKPDKTEHEWSGTIEDDNYLKYVIIADDFDQKGDYLLQAYIETPAWQGKGETVKLTVYEKFR